MANPTMNASETLTLKTCDRKRRSGRIGSTALLSTQTKTARHTTEPTKSPMIIAEPQAYCVPPHDSPRVNPAVPSETKTMPR